MSTSVRFSILVFALLILGITSSVTAKNASRIELSDGTVYEDVAFETDRQFRVIYVSVEDEEKTISFTKIVQIVDDDGEDITEEIIGKLYVKPETSEPEAVDPEPPVEVSDSVPPTDAAAGSEETWLKPETHKKKYGMKPFGASFNFHACMSAPVGDYYEGIDGGLGFGANVVIPVGRRVAIRGTVSKSGLGLDWADLSVWRYLIGGQYYNWPNWRKGGKVCYNFWTGLGATSHSAAFGFSETKFTTNYGGSVIFMMSKAMGIEFGGNIDMIWVGSGDNSDYYYGTYGDVQYAFIFDFRVGVAVML